jgi:hypothetical protein
MDNPLEPVTVWSDSAAPKQQELASRGTADRAFRLNLAFAMARLGGNLIQMRLNHRLPITDIRAKDELPGDEAFEAS